MLVYRSEGDGDMNYIKEKLYQQLAIDYCCQVSDIKDDKNYFTEYEKLEGRWRGWN